MLKASRKVRCIAALGALLLAFSLPARAAEPVGEGVTQLPADNADEAMLRAQLEQVRALNAQLRQERAALEQQLAAVQAQVAVDDKRLKQAPLPRAEEGRDSRLLIGAGLGSLALLAVGYLFARRGRKAAGTA